jgi:ATP-dependent Clp protease ATP-binding subunit ClpA
LNHRYIGLEHLLLGLLRVEQTAAAEILVEQGVDLSIVRNQLRGIAGKTGSVEEMRRLAAEARNLGTAIVRKAERIEAICDQLTESSSDQEREKS